MALGYMARTVENALDIPYYPMMKDLNVKLSQMRSTDGTCWNKRSFSDFPMIDGTITEVLKNHQVSI